MAKADPFTGSPYGERTDGRRGGASDWRAAARAAGAVAVPRAGVKAATPPAPAPLKPGEGRRIQTEDG